MGLVAMKWVSDDLFQAEKKAAPNPPKEPKLKPFIGVRWARASVAPGQFCMVEAHAETDYRDPKMALRVCGVCLPEAKLRKVGGLKMADSHKHAKVETVA